MGSRSIFVDTHVAVNSTKRLNSATGTQKWVTFALQASYKSLRTADNNIYLTLHVKCPTLLSDFSEISRYSTDFRKIPQCQIPSKAIQSHPR